MEDHCSYTMVAKLETFNYGALNDDMGEGQKKIRD